MNAPSSGKVAAPALADFILLNEEIAALVRARIPLEPHLAQLGTELPGIAGALAQRIGQRLETGESLDTAMQAEIAGMPATYRAAVAVGEKSGELAAALESLVDAAARIDSIRRATGAALLYPIIVLVIACLLFPIVVLGVMPSFAWIDRSPYRAFEWLGSSPQALIAAAILLPAFVCLIAARWWRRTRSVGGPHSKRKRWLNWFPGAKRVHHWSQLAIFSETMALLVERGVPLEQTLALAGEMTDDSQLQEAATGLSTRVARGELGRSSNEPLDEFPLLIRLALRHVSDRPLLVGSFQQAAVIYHERAKRAAEWYAEYAPIVLTMAIGGTVAVAFALSIFWPYTSLLKELGHWRFR